MAMTYECGVDFCESCMCCIVCYPTCCQDRDDGVCWVSDEAYAAARTTQEVVGGESGTPGGVQDLGEREVKGV